MCSSYSTGYCLHGEPSALRLSLYELRVRLRSAVRSGPYRAGTATGLTAVLANISASQGAAVGVHKGSVLSETGDLEDEPCTCVSNCDLIHTSWAASCMDARLVGSATNSVSRSSLHGMESTAALATGDLVRASKLRMDLTCEQNRRTSAQRPMH